MNTGELACSILDRMAELMNNKEKITGFEICQELTGKIDDQEFISLVKELIALGIVEEYGFVGRDEIGYFIQLSDIGKNTVEKIKDIEMQKYFIVAITIYCNPRKFYLKELSELLSKTNSFESKDEVERIIENFRGAYGINENPIMIEGNVNSAMEIEDHMFSIFFIDELK